MAEANHLARHPEDDSEYTSGHGPVLTAESARQGEVSGHVRRILAASLMLIVLAFAILYVVGI